ncbi:hypothetical protein [Sulfoacidibacillus thermotolerans]|uniref:Uncharacterized protein n=1 Tax=Sulfoacidibacillus thermotolerans TaxID=1765684 RepID=A0A2U3DA56_SULT2|nr:hypothetical protein [Sulfoacidibacillus thermotolerans]PWI58168.1 hypothetical protein BM613_04320 [Sulfoacidibacillus thermotolerans]
MTESTWRRWLSVPFLILYALWVMVFYQLVFTAWTLQYSYFGILLVIAASLLFMYAFPLRDRRLVVRLTLFCLMASIGIASFAGESLIWRIIDFIVFVGLALTLGRVLVGVRTLRLFFIIVALTIVQIFIPLHDLRNLAFFNVRYIGHLASPDPQVPSLPVAAVSDPVRPGMQEIVTLRGHRPIKDEAQDLVHLMNQNPQAGTTIESAIQELQHSYDVVAIRPGRLRFITHYATQRELSQLPFWSLGLMDFPFTTSHFLNLQDRTRMYVSLSADPGTLLSMLLSPGTVAQSMADLSLKTASTEAQNWKQVTGHQIDVTDGLSLQGGYLTGTYQGLPVHVRTRGVAILGVYHLLPQNVDANPQVVVEGNNVIQVLSLPPERPHVIATLKGSYLHPLTTDVVFADLTGKHRDALLVNTVPAQIFQLTSAGEWQRLWVSGRDSFRFETVFPRKGGDLLIANAPSLINTSPTRYLGGYIYHNGQLQRVFRVYYPNYVDLQTVHVTSATRPELLTSVFAHQEIVLLGLQRVPWLWLIEAGYVLAIAVGLARRLQLRRRVLR